MISSSRRPLPSTTAITQKYRITIETVLLSLLSTTPSSSEGTSYPHVNPSRPVYPNRYLQPFERLDHLAMHNQSSTTLSYSLHLLPQPRGTSKPPKAEHSQSRHAKHEPQRLPFRRAQRAVTGSTDPVRKRRIGLWRVHAERELRPCP